MIKPSTHEIGFIAISYTALQRFFPGLAKGFQGPTITWFRVKLRGTINKRLYCGINQRRQHHVLAPNVPSDCNPFTSA
jgi:hypothetical protein